MGKTAWGDWRKMPDYREGWSDPNSSAIGGLIGNTFGVDQNNPVTGELFVLNRVLSGANQILAPVLKAESEGPGQADPIRQTLSQVAPETHKQYQDWWNNHGGDVAAIAAATYFTGGAAGAALQSGEGAAGAGGAGAAAAAAPAASGGAGAAGGTAGLSAAGAAAITPELAYAGGAAGGLAGAGGGAAAGGLAGAAGSTTGSLLAANAITPALSTIGLEAAGPGIAGAAGSGTLGTAGSAAASNAVTPYLASIGEGSQGISALGKAAQAIRYGNTYRSNIMNLMKTDSHADLNRNKQLQLAEIIANSRQPKKYVAKRY